MKTNFVIAIFLLFIISSVSAQDKKSDPARAVPASMTTAPAATTPAPAPANPNAPEFKFNEEEFNFGTIKQGESVTHEFTFTNVGKEPLIITSAAGSCGCTVPVWPKEPIAKGEKATIKVTFNSAGKMGMQDKTVTIQSNAKTSPMVIHMKGNVEAAPKTPDAPATPVTPATPATGGR
jgi:hypothetical protein